MKVISSVINPITKTDYPDPDIIRVGNIYYMISTTMYFFPGGEILRSYDLVHWEIATHIFVSLDETPAERLENGENCYGKGMWAASLRYHEGRFYVVFVSHGQENTHLFISSITDGADMSECTWEHRRIQGYYHDCSLLFDDDGRIFLVHGNMQIHLTELKEDLTGPKEGGIDKLIIRDNPEKVILGYEGSHFYKINGLYYLTLIHWPKDSRRTESVFVCDTVDGEYIGRDVCCDDMGYHNMGVAQGGIVDTPDGRWYSVMFRDSGAVGRMPVLVPVTFPMDAYSEEAGLGKSEVGRSYTLEAYLPVFGEEGTVPEEFEVPDGKPGYVYESLFTSDDFVSDGTEAKLKSQWQWNHVPDDGLWELLLSGGLKITTGKVCTNLVQARNVLTQRMYFPGCAGDVTVDCSGLKDGDFAGLCVHQGCYGFIGVMKEEDRYYLVRLVKSEPVKGFGIGSSDTQPGVITDRVLIEKPTVRVRIEADFADMKDTARFFYEKDSAGISLGEEHKPAFRLDHFTGARFGLAVFSTKQAGGSAVFTHFRYEKQK